MSCGWAGRRMWAESIATSIPVHHLPHHPAQAETEDDEAGEAEDHGDHVDAAEEHRAEDEEVAADEQEPEFALPARLGLLDFDRVEIVLLFALPVLLQHDMDIVRVVRL